MIELTLLLIAQWLQTGRKLPGSEWNITETITTLELAYMCGAAMCFILRAVLLAGSVGALRAAKGAAVLKLVAWINIVGDIARLIVQIGFLTLGALSMLVPSNPSSTFVATIIGWLFSALETYLVISALIDWRLRQRLLKHTQTYVLLEECIDPDCKHPAHKAGLSHTGPAHKEA